MSDLIDRQAALDAFGLSEKTRKYGGDHSGYDTRMLYEIQNVLEDLPSAQPKTEERMEKSAQNIPKGDLVSRKGAIDAVTFGITYAKAIDRATGEVKELFAKENEELRKAVERIEQLPSAQPEIIRCKDCKFYREYGCQRAFVYLEPEDFCSRAERREE